MRNWDWVTFQDFLGFKIPLSTNFIPLFLIPRGRTDVKSAPFISPLLVPPVKCINEERENQVNPGFTDTRAGGESSVVFHSLVDKGL